LLYALILVIAFLRGRARLAVTSALLASLALFEILPSFPLQPTLRATFLSVGQGDGAVVELPDGAVLVVDAGGAAAGHDDPGARVLAPFLRSRGIRSIDLAVLSHPHPDHFGGMASLAEHFPIKTLWTNGGTSSDPRYGRLMKATLGSERYTPKDGPSPYEGF